MSEKRFDEGELFDLEHRLQAAEASEEDVVSANHARARVHRYMQSAPARGRRFWTGPLTAFAVIGVPAVAAAAIAAALILGTPKPVGQVQPAGTPDATPAATPSLEPSASPSAAPPPRTFLVETSNPANQAGPVTVHWVGLDGKELAAQQLPANEAVLGSGGGRVLVYRSDGHVIALHTDGSTQDVGSGMPTSSSPGQVSVPVRALVGPDGQQWIWSTMTNAGTRITSHIWLGRDGEAPRAVASATQDSIALQPYSWTLANPLIAHQAVGIGGYILFNQAHGQVGQLDLGTGRTTTVGPPSNGLGEPAGDVALAGNGAVAYTQAQGTMGFVIVNGPGMRGLSANVPVANQTGALLFDAGSSHLVYCTSPAAGPPHEHFETHIINLNSGAQTKFGPADLRPAAWAPDGRMVEFRTASDGDGKPGTFLVALDGTATRVGDHSQFVGFVQLP
jgi:hypothetical protein